MDQIPCTLDRRAISALITVLSTVFRKEKWRIVGAPGIAEGSPSTQTNVRLRERPAGYFMLRCDSQDLTLQAILSNGVATVRQTLRRMFSAMAAERAKKRRTLVLRPGLRTDDQHPPATDAFTPRSGYGWSRAKHGDQAG